MMGRASNYVDFVARGKGTRTIHLPLRSRSGLRLPICAPALRQLARVFLRRRVPLAKISHAVPFRQAQGLEESRKIGPAQ